MPLLRRLTAAEQVAAHLRAELGRGRWGGVMPGQMRLAKELGVARNTVEAALRQLEREGVLAGQGPGRKRRILPFQDGVALRQLRVAILLHESVNRQLDYIVELQHALEDAGHTVQLCSKSLVELDFKLSRIRRLCEQTEADAWLVCAGTREVLEWFSAQSTPTFALFGRRTGLPIASTGPDKAGAYAATTRELIRLGHRRIVLLARPMRRLPEPGRPERAFLDALAARHIRTSSFNLPDWDESGEAFQALLNSLFQVTPPTALLVDEAPLFVATFQFLARGGLRVPEDVSLICTDPDPAFAWCKPSIAHIRWDSRPVVRRIVRWVANVSRGQRDVRQTFVPAEFVPGGTMGPAPGQPVSVT